MGFLSARRQEFRRSLVRAPAGQVSQEFQANTRACLVSPEAGHQHARVVQIKLHELGNGQQGLVRVIGEAGRFGPRGPVVLENFK